MLRLNELFDRADLARRDAKKLRAMLRETLAKRWKLVQEVKNISAEVVRIGPAAPQPEK